MIGELAASRKRDERSLFRSGCCDLFKAAKTKNRSNIRASIRFRVDYDVREDKRRKTPVP